MSRCPTCGKDLGVLFEDGEHCKSCNIIANLRADNAALQDELKSVRSGSAKVCRELRAELAALRKDLDWLDDRLGLTEMKELFGEHGVASDGGPRTIRAAIAAVRKRECDHEWEFIDESFDHEFGTEVVHVWECTKCGKSTRKKPFPDDV